MKKINISRKRKIIVGALLLLVISTASIFIFITNSASKNVSTAINGPAFIFEATKAQGWWGGESNYPKDEITEDFQGDISELPNASMSVSKGTQEVPEPCFVNYFYWKNSVDIEVAFADMKERTISGDKGLSLDEIGSRVLAFETFEGSKEYTLHQYEIVGSPSNSIARGIELGYVPLSSGYIEIRGYCEVASRLVDTVTALSAVKLR